MKLGGGGGGGARAVRFDNNCVEVFPISVCSRAALSMLCSRDWFA